VVDEASSRLAFGTELRRRRLAAGHSLTDLANLVNYSKSHLSKIESGSKTAGVALARRCDQALNHCPKVKVGL